MYDEDSFIMLSAIQHYAFCPRQCALIHVEDIWQENILTTKGKIMHERVDRIEHEERPGVRFVRALKIHSYTLGLSGKCDLVEFRKNGAVFPVEYKRGKPKEGNLADVYQLTAQALCLEEMLGIKIDKGALYYGRIKRRIRVDITDKLKNDVRSIVEQIHKMIESKQTPKAVYSKKCRRCSLLPACVPKSMRERKLKSYMKGMYEYEETP